MRKCLGFVKSKLNGTFIHKTYWTIKMALLFLRGKQIDIQRFKNVDSAVERLGSPSASWHYYPTEELNGAVVICAGVGEDISFEVELCARHNCQVLFVDPTPRAVSHFHATIQRCGKMKEKKYSNSGAQDPLSYDLSKVKKRSQLVLYESALWNKITELKFFAPKNEKNVSHSISNFQHQYADNTPHLVVGTTTVDTLLRIHGLEDLALLKLDIEGAEVEVIQCLLKNKIYPGQILVEFDELIDLTKYSKKRIEKTIAMLREANYVLRWRSGFSDFLFVRQSILKT